MLETVFLEELVFHQLVIPLLLLCLNVVVIVNEIDFLADVQCVQKCVFGVVIRLFSDVWSFSAVSE